MKLLKNQLLQIRSYNLGKDLLTKLQSLEAFFEDKLDEVQDLRLRHTQSNWRKSSHDEYDIFLIVRLFISIAILLQLLLDKASSKRAVPPSA